MSSNVWSPASSHPTGGSSTPFTPTDLTDLALWLDASTLNLGAVAVWPDGSNNGYDATQAVADNRPICAVADGRRVVQMVASPTRQWLELLTAGDLFRNLSDFMVAWVGFVGVGDGTLLAASINGDPTAQRIAIGLPSSDAGTVDGAFNDSTPATRLSVTAITGFPAWITTLVWATTESSTAPIVAESAGAASATGYEGSPIQGAMVGPSPDTSSDLVIVGADGSLAGDGDAWIAELVVVRGIPPIGQRRQLVEYLAAKWSTL